MVSIRVNNSYLLSFLFFLIAFQASATTIALSSPPNNLNPLFSSDSNSQNINRLVYLSLIDFSDLMEPFCVACHSFKEEFGDDGKYRIHFQLKEGLKFHDGSEINTDSVIEVYRIFTNEDQDKSIFRFAFKKIHHVEKISNLKFIFHYDSYAFDHVTNLVLLKILKKNQNGFTGSGLYKMSENEDNQLALELVENASDYPKKLFFKVIKDETTTLLKLINKEIDVTTMSLTARKIDWLKKNHPKFHINQKAGASVAFINLNHQRSPINDLNFRKALMHLIPIDEIIKRRFKDSVERATSIYSKSFKDFYTKTPLFKYSPQLGLKYLKLSGYQNDRVLNFISSNNSSTIELAKILTQELRKHGIKIKHLPLEWGTYMRRYKGGHFDLAMGQWVGFADLGMPYYIFHSKNFAPKGGNRGRYVHEGFEQNFDLILEKPKESLLKQKDFVRKTLEDLFSDIPYVLLWHPSITWITQPCINPIIPHPTGSFLKLIKMENECQK